LSFYVIAFFGSAIPELRHAARRFLFGVELRFMNVWTHKGE
jgi:hypothetical protein